MHDYVVIDLPPGTAVLQLSQLVHVESLFLSRQHLLDKLCEGSVNGLSRTYLLNNVDIEAGTSAGSL